MERKRKHELCLVNEVSLHENNLVKINALSEEGEGDQGGGRGGKRREKESQWKDMKENKKKLGKEKCQTTKQRKDEEGEVKKKGEEDKVIWKRRKRSLKVGKQEKGKRKSLSVRKKDTG